MPIKVNKWAHTVGLTVSCINRSIQSTEEVNVCWCTEDGGYRAEKCVLCTNTGHDTTHSSFKSVCTATKLQ